MPLKYCYNFIALYLLVQMIGTVHSLKCYSCLNCKKDANEVKECSASENACLKITLDENFTKSCTRKEMCNVKDFERAFGNTWNTINTLIGKKEEKESPSKDNHDIFHCCETDYCNGGETTMTWFGFFGAMALSLLITAY